MAENQIDLKFVTNTTQLEKATKVAERLEKRITNLVNQESKGRISTEQYSAAIANLASEMQRAAGNNIKARNEVFSYSRAVYQASKATEELSSDLTVTAQSFSNVSKSSGNAAAKVNQFGENIKFSGRNVNRFGAYAQQAGYQVGDFAVQVQSGTSWLTALGQQGAQLLGIFGPAGAIAGAALAITTAIVNPLIAAFNAAENLNEELDKTLEKLQEQNRLRGLGGEETTAQIAKLTAQLIKQESQISRMEQGVRARTRGREGTTYAEELQRNLEITKQNNKELYEQRDITAARLRILIAQRDAQKALVGDQAQEAENLRKNEEFERARLAASEETAKKQRRLEDELAQKRLDSQEKWNQWRSRSNDKYFAEEQRKAKEVADKIAEEQAASVEAMKVSINQYMDVYEAGVAEMVRQHAELNDLASELGERLGISFATAVAIIRQAKAEATVGLDAFGGAGDFKYSYPSTFKPPKDKTGGGAKKETVDEYLKSLMEEAKYKRRIVGLSEEETRIQEIIFQAKQRDFVVTQEQASAIAAVEEQTRKLIDAEQRRKSMMETIEGHITNGFMAMIDGSSSVENAFKGMLRNILLEIYRQQVAEPIAKGIGGFFSKLFSANGNVFSNGAHVKAFANGGVVSGTTAFPMRGGVGIMGEAGPEAIMPLKRGPDGKLGVEVSGGGGGVTIIQNNSFGAGVSRAEINAMLPKIVETTKAAVFDAQRRSVGGRGYA